MAHAKITKTEVDGCKPGPTESFLWDIELRGFGLRVAPSGTKTYFAQYRVGGGRSGPTRRFSIGRTDRLTPQEARRKAKKVLSDAAHGLDPSGERKATRGEVTVAELIDRFEKEGAANLGERTRRYTLARLRHHVVPLIGTKKISSIKVTDIKALMKAVEDGKTARVINVGPRRRIVVRGGVGAAAKAIRDLSAVFSFAREAELISVNPCRAIRKPADGKRERFLTLEEIGRLGEALNSLDFGQTNSKALAITRLWALTGCRRNEIASLEWSEVDFEHSCLRLKHSKTGKSVRPLAVSALAVLQMLSREDAQRFVFPSEDGRSFYQGTKRVWPKIVKLANLPGVTPHTLRHTFGSAAVSSGETLVMTGALLGHSNARSTSIYAHMQTDPTQRAVNRVVGGIAAALSGRKPEKVG